MAFDLVTTRARSALAGTTCLFIASVAITPANAVSGASAGDPSPDADPAMDAGVDGVDDGDPLERRLAVVVDGQPPTVATPNEALALRVRVTPGEHPITSVVLWTRPHRDLDFLPAFMVQIPGLPDRWEGIAGCAPCGAVPAFYVEVLDAGGRRASWPPEGPRQPATYDVGYALDVLPQDGAPEPGSGEIEFPRRADSEAAGGSAAGEGAGVVRGDGSLEFGPWDVSWTEAPVLRYERRLSSTDKADRLLAEVSGDDGLTWEPIELSDRGDEGWMSVATGIYEVIPSARIVRLRFRVIARGGSTHRLSVARASIASIECAPRGGPDVDGDGSVGLSDLISVLSQQGPCPADQCPADVDGSGAVDFQDLLDVVAAWTN